MTPVGRMKKDLPLQNRVVHRPKPENWTVGEDPVTFTLTANAGVMVGYGTRRILVDGLHRGADPFSGVPERLLEAVIAGDPPFSGITRLLYTHLHPDHFSAEATGRFLRRNPGAGLVLPAGGNWPEGESLYAAVKAENPGLWELAPRPGEILERGLEKDIRLRVFSARHAGEEYAAVPHICFLLTFGTRNVLFLGDADYDADFFAGMLAGIPIHAAVANPLFISGARGRKALLEGVRPERIIVNHIPFQGEDPLRFRDMTARCLERYKKSLPPAAVLWDPADAASI